MTELTCSTDLAAPVSDVFRHCTSSAGFEQLFPYRVRWRSAPDTWTSGDLLDFRYRVAPGIWLTHRARIVEFRENELFVDEMVSGPYQLFRHVHLFEPTSDGGTRVIDHLDVTTRFGRVVDRMLCRGALKSTFRRRHAALGAYFSRMSDSCQAGDRPTSLGNPGEA